MNPLLYLGLIGFDASQASFISSCIEQINSKALASKRKDDSETPTWMIVEFHQADALFVCGKKLSPALDGSLRIPELSSSHSQQPLGLDLQSLQLPTAISDADQLYGVGINPPASIIHLDLTKAAGIHNALEQLEIFLLPLRNVFALAHCLTDRREDLDLNHTYHIERKGQLDLLLDVPQRRVFMRPGVQPASIDADNWNPRPASANFAPPDFFDFSFHEVAWNYALHASEPKLPIRFEVKPFKLKNLPSVRPSMLYPRHSFLFEILSQKPISYFELFNQYAFEEHFLKRDLYALYLCRAITTSFSDEASSSLSPAAKQALQVQQTESVTGQLMNLGRLDTAFPTMISPLI